MKIIILLSIAVIVALLTLFSAPKQAIGEPLPQVEIITVHVSKPSLSPAQVIWLARLMNCESGIKQTAVNPKDLDNTPSWGILQFKDSTFASFTAKYGIEGELMDGESQVAIVTEWLIRGSEVDWTRQFPACVSKLGLPPRPILSKGLPF